MSTNYEYLKQQAYLISEGRMQYITEKDGSLINHFYVKPNQVMLDKQNKIDIEQIEKNVVSILIDQYENKSSKKHNIIENRLESFDKENIRNMYDSKNHTLSTQSRTDMIRLQNFQNENGLLPNVQINAPLPRISAHNINIPQSLAKKITKAYVGYTNDLLSLLQSHMLNNS